MEQKTLAESVANKIPYLFQRDFLVKQLEPEKVKKEFHTPVSKGETDKDGVKAKDYDEVKTEVKEVDSDWRKGIVIAIPNDYKNQSNRDELYLRPLDIKLGDTVVYRANNRYFDLIKDTVLVSAFDILAVEKTSEN